jgi:hypothetical protein
MCILWTPKTFIPDLSQVNTQQMRTKMYLKPHVMWSFRQSEVNSAYIFQDSDNMSAAELYRFESKYI